MSTETLQAIEGYNKEKEILVNQLCKIGMSNSSISLQSRLREIDKAIKELLTKAD